MSVLCFFGRYGNTNDRVGTPGDGEAATNGNGTMLAIPVGSRENVEKITPRPGIGGDR